MERKHNIFFIFLLMSSLFFALIAIFMLFDFFSPRQTNSSEPSNDIIDVGVESTIIELTENYSHDCIDKTVFLGESTTYGLWSYGILSEGVNTKQVWSGATERNGMVVSSGTLSLSPSIATTKIYYPDDNTALTISEAIKLKKPEYLIITLGLNNGASYYSESEFKDCYRILLDSINSSYQNTTVILQSLFPVSQKCMIKAYTPQKIDTCNQWICDIAEEYSLKYLNTIEVLSDENGYLVPEYDNGGDGIHLNALGLNAVIEYVKKHGYSEE